MPQPANAARHDLRLRQRWFWLQAERRISWLPHLILGLDVRILKTTRRLGEGFQGIHDVLLVLLPFTPFFLPANALGSRSVVARLFDLFD